MGAAGVFLQSVADGATPAVPLELPPEVATILEELLKAMGQGS